MSGKWHYAFQTVLKKNNSSFFSFFSFSSQARLKKLQCQDCSGSNNVIQLPFFVSKRDIAFE